MGEEGKVPDVRLEQHGSHSSRSPAGEGRVSSAHSGKKREEDMGEQVTCADGWLVRSSQQHRHIYEHSRFPRPSERDR